MVVATMTLVKPDFAYTLNSGSPDVVTLCFGSGGPVLVLADDPGLDQIQRGDRITFKDCRIHTDFWPRSYTVHTIDEVQRYAPTYKADV